MLVLQRAGDDFGGRGGARIDQHDYWQALRVIAGLGIIAFDIALVAAALRHDLAAFQDHIRVWPAVRECWKLSGDIDFMLKCVAPDLKAFQDFVGELTALPNVRNVRTALAFDRVKDEPIVPFG